MEKTNAKEKDRERARKYYLTHGAECCARSYFNKLGFSRSDVDDNLFQCKVMHIKLIREIKKAKRRVCNKSD